MIENKCSQIDAPIFIFSFSWRSGSTLIQRVINSSGEAIIWGEPHILNVLRECFDRLLELSHETQWARDSVKNNGWEKSWAPTIQPAPEFVNESAKKFFQNLYATPTHDKGVEKWGFKEVRRHAAKNASFLREVYPGAKIVFHFRNPLYVYSSIRKTDFFHHFKNPLEPIHIWNDNAIEVCNLINSGFECFLIDHESFVESREAREELYKYLGIEAEDIDKALETKTGSTSKGEYDLGEMNEQDIQEITNEGLNALANLKSKRRDNIWIM